MLSEINTTFEIRHKQVNSHCKKTVINHRQQREAALIPKFDFPTFEPIINKYAGIILHKQ